MHCPVVEYLQQKLSIVCSLCTENQSLAEDTDLEAARTNHGTQSAQTGAAGVASGEDRQGGPYRQDTGEQGYNDLKGPSSL